MSVNKIIIWQQLTNANLVEGELPATINNESPWYIKVMLAFSGWLAALFLMIFVALMLEYILSSSTAMFCTGLVMIGISYLMLHKSSNEFVQHLALAISLAGQGWATFALFEMTSKSFAMTWGLVGLMQTALIMLMPHFIHRVFSTFIATLAFSFLLIVSNLPYVFSGVMMFVAAWLWLNEFNYPKHLKTIHAIGYGIILALIPIKGHYFFGNDISDWNYAHNYTYDYSKLWLQPWMGEALMGLVVFYLVWKLVQRNFKSLQQPAVLWIFAGTFLLCLASLEARGLITAVIILLLGYANSNRVLMGLGTLSLLVYISSYYYLLDTTLLNKSFSLMAIGAILLVLRWLMIRMTIKTSEHNYD